MTNSSIFIHHVNDGFSNILNAEINAIKVSRTGLFICLNGEVDFIIDGVTYCVTQNMIATYFAYSELKIERRSSDLKGIIIGGNLEAIQSLLYKISDFNSLFLIKSNPVTEISEIQKDNLLRYSSLIEDVIGRINGQIEPEKEQTIPMKEMRRMQMELIANSLMLNVVSCYTNFDSQSKLTTHREDVLRRFIASLYANYKEKHDVGYYAQEQFLTSRYFSSIIKDMSGRTPSEWITTALLVDAKNKLRQSPMTIKEVSDKLGFPNQSYFGKWFKNLTGIGPLDYKNGKEEKIKDDDKFTEMIKRETRNFGSINN